PRPPTSTLFPYTTLFRSSLEPCFSLANLRPRTRSYGHGGVDLLHGRDGARAPRRRQPVRDGARGAAGDARSSPCTDSYRLPSSGDRKSTRLNSSHVSISY